MARRRSFAAAVFALARRDRRDARAGRRRADGARLPRRRRRAATRAHALAIPKNIPGAVRIDLIAGGEGDEAAEALVAGAIVEATLRGPSFPARRVVGLPNADLLLPPLPLVGDYSLDDLRLVDAATGAPRLDGSPRSIPINVFDDVLVSRVTSRPLTLDEIEDRGIAIDESNFRVLSSRSASSSTARRYR